jgi:uncharacterized protein YraI
MVSLEEPLLPNRLRGGPGRNNEQIGVIEPGEMANIIGGPACADEMTWWQVETEQGLFGWPARATRKATGWSACLTITPNRVQPPAAPGWRWAKK